MSLVICAAISKAAIIASEGRAMCADGVTVASEEVPKHHCLSPSLVIGAAGRTDSMEKAFDSCQHAWARTGDVESVRDALRKSWTPAPAANGQKFGAFLVSQSVDAINVLVIDESGERDCRLSDDEHFLLLDFAPSGEVKRLVENSLLPALEQSRNRPSQFVVTMRPLIRSVFLHAAARDHRLNLNVKASTMLRCSARSPAAMTI